MEENIEDLKKSLEILPHYTITQKKESEIRFKDGNLSKQFNIIEKERVKNLGTLRKSNNSGKNNS